MKFKSGEKLTYFRQVHPRARLDVIFVSQGKLKSRVKLEGTDKILIVAHENLERRKCTPAQSGAFQSESGFTK